MQLDTGSHPAWPSADATIETRPRPKRQRTLADMSIPVAGAISHVPAEASAVVPVSPVEDDEPQPSMARVWSHVELLVVSVISLALAAALGG